jgi:hypothetical protein
MADWYDHDRDEHNERRNQWRSDDGTVRPSKPYNHRLPDLAPELWRDFYEYLGTRGLSPHIAKENLWYPMKSDPLGENWPGRIVMPATSRQEGNHFYQSRIMYDGPGKYRRYDSPTGCSSGDAVIVVYPQGPTIWNESVVVEGPMCALAAAQTGRLGIALMGADPPIERIEWTSELIHGTRCYVIPDRDRLDALSHVMANLANRGHNCKLLMVEGAKDLADLSPGKRSELFR